MLSTRVFTIGVLSYPQVQRAAVYGLVDLLESADRLHQQTLSASDGPVVDAPRLTVEIIESISEAQADRFAAVILPPSLDGDTAACSARYADWLKTLHQQGVLICSVCAGAFLLAQAGLLENRLATTHWGLADAFRQRYPDVKLDTDKLIIDDGDIITAGGLMAWIDLGLKLVDRYLGSSAMLATARYLLVDPGGREQRFYSVFSPALNHGDSAILKVQHWLQTRYAEPVTVKVMGEEAGLSSRTFIRRFQQATGLNPSEYLQHLRIGKARSLMESSSLSVDEIAWQTGYRDTSAFRRIFHKIIGLTPREYRHRFNASGSCAADDSE